MLRYIKDDDFDNEINKEGTYIVDFFANWCGPCMKLDPIIKEIADSRNGYNVLKVDVDENNNLARKLNIDTIPTICIYKDGKVVDKRIGYMSKEELLDVIEKNN